MTRWMMVFGLMVAVVGCGDDGCPPLGSNRSGIVNVTALELSGDCGPAMQMELNNGLLTLEDCLLGPTDGPSADSCEETIAVACNADDGSAFGWLGSVSYIGDGQFQGEVRLRALDDLGPICESFYLVTYTEL
jgi:hypothetical protein